MSHHDTANALAYCCYESWTRPGDRLAYLACREEISYPNNLSGSLEGALLQNFAATPQAETLSAWADEAVCVSGTLVDSMYAGYGNVYCSRRARRQNNSQHFS